MLKNPETQNKSFFHSQNKIDIYLWFPLLFQTLFKRNFIILETISKENSKPDIFFRKIFQYYIVLVPCQYFKKYC